MPLPIPSTPAPPIGAAIAYGARQSYEKDREFALQAQQISANIAAQQQQAQLRQQQARQEAYQFEANKFLQAQQMQQRAYEFDVGADLDYSRQEEQAYQFDQSRQPSERDVFQSQVEFDRRQQSAELQVWAAEQEVTIQEQSKLKEMKRRVSEVEAMPWSREEKDEALSILKTGIDPLERRTRRTQEQREQEELRRMATQTDTAAQQITRKQMAQSKILQQQGVDVEMEVESDPVVRGAREQARQVQEAVMARGLMNTPQGQQAVMAARQQAEQVRQQATQSFLDRKLQQNGGWPTLKDPATGKEHPYYLDQNGNPQVIDFPAGGSSSAGQGKPVDPQQVWREAVSRVRASDPEKKLQGETFLNAAFKEYENAMRHLSTEVPGRSGPGGGRSGSQSPAGGGQSQPVERPKPRPFDPERGEPMDDTQKELYATYRGMTDQLQDRVRRGGVDRQFAQMLRSKIDERFAIIKKYTHAGAMTPADRKRYEALTRDIADYTRSLE
jgi:hypothetical protein